MFEIVDDRVSRHWRVSTKRPDALEVMFSEWVSDELFAEKLFDCLPEQVAVFVRRKKEMDLCARVLANVVYDPR